MEVKKEAGVPDNLVSCHTAKIGGYFIEGHVPAEDLRKLLKAKPDAKGISVANMPAGSPGMNTYPMVIVGNWLSYGIDGQQNWLQVNGTSKFKGGSNYVNNQWYHFAISNTPGTNGCSLYVDGS